MSWLTIVDTIVKVGLGAVISGVLALLLARQNQKAQLQKDYLKRRQGFLDLFMEDFEPLHIEIYEHTGKIHAFLSTIDAGYAQDIEVGEQSVGSDKNIEDALAYRAGLILYKLQAKLLYLQLNPIADLLNEYRLTSMELLSSLPDVDELVELLQQGKHPYDQENISRFGQTLSGLRDKIYLQLGKADRGEPLTKS